MVRSVMRSGVGAGNHRAITVTASVHLALEFDAGDEPIAGRIRAEDGSTREFVGWLELTRALDDARKQAVGPGEAP